METGEEAVPSHNAAGQPEFSFTEARDELNLAEFPLCCIADRAEPGKKTLTFEDRIRDSSRGETVTRKLLVTGSEEYGLPTALDDEVLLGLIQLSKLREFADRKVFFTRYQLLRLLNWPDETKNYQRLEKSLNRWVGVTLFYKNAWWDKADQCWVDEKFHVLDNVTLFDWGGARRKEERGRQPPLALSSFVWNEIIFRSFKAGNLKSIDFEFYTRLESAVAKRLYRFLDKRFYRSKHLEFDLKELAWEHVGLSRQYDVANLKRKLRRGISELEATAFLAPMPDAHRYRKVRSGQWRIVFERTAKSNKNGTARKNTTQAEVETLKIALIQRGVTASVAEELVAQYPSERILHHVGVFDWVSNEKERTVAKNPAGFLVSSIIDDYVPPKGFFSQKQNTEQKTKQINRDSDGPEAAESDPVFSEIFEFLASLSDEKRKQFEAEAMTNAGASEKNWSNGEGTLARAAKQQIFEKYALKILRQRKLL